MNTALFRHGRACPDHPRLQQCHVVFKTWMLATRASMTNWNHVVFMRSGLRPIGLSRNDDSYELQGRGALMRIIRAADCKIMRWKNGGGTTTEIAVSPEGASLSDFDWRISMAHVGQDGPFSSFPGIDRTLSVLTGNGIRLAFGDGETALLDRATAPFFFAADRAVDGVLVDGAIDDLNVMSRRSHWQHRVERLSSADSLAVNDGLLVLVARKGDWQVNGAALPVGDSAVLDAPGSVELTVGGDQAELYAVWLMAS
uniref:HutD family protein n=1 Tax=Bosea sp. NBC_00436 TaxID=2969620 RepID=A0A9E7ZWW4_9HYPH